MNAEADRVLVLRQVSCARGGTVVRNADLDFAAGTFNLLAGEAGSGHDLLLRLCGWLETPDAGEVIVARETARDCDQEATAVRRAQLFGFVFAAPFLLPALSVIENVAMPLFKASAVQPPEARHRSEALLEFVGMKELAQRPCGELAPLEQHCVALARALVNEPPVVLIESLDQTLAGEELRAFATLLRQVAACFDVAVIASASPAFLPEPGDRVVAVIDGALCLGSGLPAKFQA